jgi:hypothetical protein
MKNATWDENEEVKNEQKEFKSGERWKGGTKNECKWFVRLF